MVALLAAGLALPLIGARRDQGGLGDAALPGRGAGRALSRACAAATATGGCARSCGSGRISSPWCAASPTGASGAGTPTRSGCGCACATTHVEKYLTLEGNGREIELGAFLSPGEREALHGELRDARSGVRPALAVAGGRGAASRWTAGPRAGARRVGCAPARAAVRARTRATNPRGSECFASRLPSSRSRWRPARGRRRVHRHAGERARGLSRRATSSGAREDLDYAGKLLTAMKSEALAKFLPAALPGWTREEAAAEDAAAAGGFMGMLGGGTTRGGHLYQGGGGADDHAGGGLADGERDRGDDLRAWPASPAASRCASSAPSSPTEDGACRAW